MPKKLTYEEVKNLVKSKGGVLLSTEYINSHTPLLIRTKDGVEETRILVNIRNTKAPIYSKNYSIKSLSDTSRNGLERIREILIEHGVQLLSEEYINDITPIRIKFEDGEVEERTWTSLRNSIRKKGKLTSKKAVIDTRSNKRKLGLDVIRDLVESKGGKLLSAKYTSYDEPFTIETIDGVIEDRGIQSIKLCDKLYSKNKVLKDRAESQKFSIEHVRNMIEERKGKMLSKEYNGFNSPILIETCDGVIEERTLCNIKDVKVLTSNSSSFQYEILEYLRTLYDGQILMNDRSLVAPYELDILLKDVHLAIECNGIFWHSDKYKDKFYHLQKTSLINELGYDLIHITDSDWEFRQDIIKDILAKRLGVIDRKIPARKCIAKEVSNIDAKEFLETNHLQGHATASHRYGLYYNDELVSIITILKSRFNKNYEYELARFANKLGCSVIGGFSKLLKLFIKLINPKNIISYCDIAYFKGNIYKANDFVWVNRSAPNYKYFKPGSLLLESRNKYQKHKLLKQLDVFNPELSEYQNMVNNGYMRIWDCGNDVYVWYNETKE